MKKIMLSIITMLFFIGNIRVSADSFLPPEPYKIELEDGNKIFYITPPNYDGDEYLATGLYYNAAPPEAIYLVSRRHGSSNITYFNESNVFLSDDGMYFAHIPAAFYFSSQNGFEHELFNDRIDAVALEFYANGNLIHQYNVSQLVRDKSRLDFTTTMIAWGIWEPVQFDTKNNTLSITTADDITYTFEITTGEIIDENYSSRVLKNPVTGDKSITVNAIVLLAAGIIFMRWAAWLARTMFPVHRSPNKKSSA